MMWWYFFRLNCRINKIYNKNIKWNIIKPFQGNPILPVFFKNRIEAISDIVFNDDYTLHDGADDIRKSFEAQIKFILTVNRIYLKISESQRRKYREEIWLIMQNNERKFQKIRIYQGKLTEMEEAYLNKLVLLLMHEKGWGEDFAYQFSRKPIIRALWIAWANSHPEYGNEYKFYDKKLKLLLYWNALHEEYLNNRFNESYIKTHI